MLDRVSIPLRWIAVPSLSRLFTLAAIVGLSAWVGIELTHESHRVSAIWIPNAIIFAVVAARPVGEWIPILFVGYAANATGNLAFGDPLEMGLFLAACNTLEIGAALLMTRGWFDGSGMMSKSQMLRFLLCCVCIAPLLSGLLGANYISAALDTDFLPIYMTWVAAHGLGMAIFVPVIRTMQDSTFSSLFGEEKGRGTLICLAIVAAVTIYVFWQSTYPFLFLIFPALFTTAFYRGFAGASLAVAVTAIIAMAFTLAGYGPLILIEGAGIGERLLMVQFFLLISFLTIFTFVVEMSIREKLEQELRENEALYRLLADNASDIILRLSKDGRFVYVSPSVTDRLGWRPADLAGKFAQDILHPEEGTRMTDAVSMLHAGNDKAMIAYRVRTKAGLYLWMEGSIKQLRDPKTGETRGFIAQMRDISERKQAEKERDEAHHKLELLATLDGLTGLANRRHFNETLDREWRRMQREGRPLSLLMLDVDHFKLYNDIYGHQMGDICLERVGQLLSKAARRPGDLAARYGGEEFALILPNTDRSAALRIAEGICEAIRREEIEHRANVTGWVTVSIGVAEAVIDGEDIDAFIRAADIALYRAKDEGRNRAKTAA